MWAWLLKQTIIGSTRQRQTRSRNCPDIVIYNYISIYGIAAAGQKVITLQEMCTTFGRRLRELKTALHRHPVGSLYAAC